MGGKAGLRIAYSNQKENYRPVSCLPTASKVLEKVVCDQTTQYMEKNSLFPENQHGFRQNRSTMTALAAMQQQWIKKTEGEEKTGILLWDLTAAYDTIDADLLVQKLEVYGFSIKTCEWFLSFLKGRTQKVKIGEKTSSSVELASGMPQGGILSPVLFIVFVSDMEDWTVNAGVFTYADDTSTDSSSKIVKEVLKNLENNAERVLKYMASNGLVANPTKTVFMMIGEKEDANMKVKVGDALITRSRSAKLLGMDIDDDMKWKTHMQKLVVNLDRRLFQVRRMVGKISNKGLKKVADSIWTSKLRYGLQLLQEVRTKEEQLKNAGMSLIQKAQNRLLRTLNRKKRIDHVSITDMLESTNLLSVNQLAAQIKLVEMWKSATQEKYPVKMERMRSGENERVTRGSKGIKFKEKKRTTLRKNSFIGDGAKLWNNAPETIRNAKSIDSAKKAIKTYCKTLPI